MPSASLAEGAVATLLRVQVTWFEPAAPPIALLTSMKEPLWPTWMVGTADPVGEGAPETGAPDDADVGVGDDDPQAASPKAAVRANAATAVFLIDSPVGPCDDAVRVLPAPRSCHEMILTAIKSPEVHGTTFTYHLPPILTHGTGDRMEALLATSLS